MINARIEIIIIIILTGIACAIPGVLLAKKRLARYSAGVVSTSILAIIAAYTLFGNIDIPPIILTITAVTLLIVLCMDRFVKAAVPEDSVIGVIPPLIFAAALILVSLFPDWDININLDIDSILLGELVFLPLDRISFFGFDLGPLVIYQLLGVIIINIAAVVLLGKEMLFSMFDNNYSKMIDHTPNRSRLVLLLTVIVTAVVAFRIMGIIMVLGLITAPAFIASFYARRLWLLIIAAAFAGTFSCLTGYLTAHILEITISSTMIAFLGLYLAVTALFAPGTGIIAAINRKKQLKTERAAALIIAYLFRHGQASGKTDFALRFNWSRDITNAALDRAGEYIVDAADGYILTEKGTELAELVTASCRLPDRLA
jgi:manganese/zinc/iron transport system permease protein